VDFTCYDARAAHDLGKYLLRWPVPWYIYLSSDSVYEVCEKTHSGPTRESDSVRPISLREQERLNGLDAYADGKFAAEEAFDRLWEVSKVEGGHSTKYVYVRVPDVVGPRDTALLWWYYQIIIKVRD